MYAVGGGLTALAGLLLVTASHAGKKTTQAVTVDTAQRYASGSLASARATADTTQYIGCLILSSGTTSCQARNAAGTAASCSTTDAGFRAAAQSINGDSRLIFYWDGSGNCTSLAVENYSLWAPKVP